MRVRRMVAVLGAAVAIGGGTAGVSVAGGGSAAADPVAGLQADLNRILTNPGAAGEQAGVVVRTADGKTLYSHAADDRLEPASNLKLFTSAVALDVLGPGYRFTTSALARGRRSGATLRGDLYLRGGGDPTTLAADYDAMAAQVARAGVRTVTGRLVADDTAFDHVRLGTGWAWDDEPYYYNAQVSALTVAPNTDYDAGNVIVATTPGARAGAPARLKLVPYTGYVRIVNHATTSAAGDTDLSVVRQHGTNTIVVSGTIPLGAALDQEWATVWEPTGYAADVFRRALARHGVRVVGPTGYAATPAAARVVATHRSATLASIYVPFLKLSNNGHAEALVKAMGRAVRHDGSWDAGLGVIVARLPSFGVDPADMQQVDGSGLSRMDLTSARQITNVLVGAQHRSWWRTWYDALPIAAQPDRFVGGTLRNRLVGTPAAGKVHAKTGSLTGVSSLSGYVTDAAGQRLTFSVVQNNYVDFDPETIEDQIAVRLAEYGAGPSTRGIPHVPATPHRQTGPDARWEAVPR